VTDDRISKQVID